MAHAADNKIATATMMKSHKHVLNREDAVEAAKHFKDALDLLNELLDYGTNLTKHL